MVWRPAADRALGSPLATEQPNGRRRSIARSARQRPTQATWSRLTRKNGRPAIKAVCVPSGTRKYRIAATPAVQQLSEAHHSLTKAGLRSRPESTLHTESRWTYHTHDNRMALVTGLTGTGADRFEKTDCLR